MVFVSAAPCILAIITIIINGNTTVGSKKTFISCKEDNTPQKWCALPNSGSLGLRSVANDNKFECLYTLQCRYTYIYDNKFRTFAHTLNIIAGLFGLNIVLLHTAPHNCNYYYYADFFFIIVIVRLELSSPPRLQHTITVQSTTFQCSI